MAVFGVVILNVFFFSVVDDGGKPFGSQLTLDDLFQRNYEIHDPEANWISGKCVRNPNSNSSKNFWNYLKSCLSHALSMH